jgi:phenylacetate-CoA ligase
MAWRRYWDEGVETMPVEQLREADEEHLRQQIAYCHQRSAYYQEKLSAAGVDPSSIRAIEDLASLPLSTKDELRHEQANDPPLGGYRCAPPDRIVRLHGTSGTTGRMLLTALTAADADLVAECGARSLWSAGMRPDDVVFHVFNYSIYSGGVTDHLSAERLGAAVMPIGVGQSQAFVDLAAQAGATAVHSTPSYPLYLARKMRTEMGRDAHGLGLRKGFFGGEPGAGIPEVQQQLRDELGLEPFDANYGMSEVVSLFAAECEQRDGLHFFGQGAVIVELIEPETGAALPLASGAEGELVYTSINREATPLLRYRSGDVAQIISDSPCRCGRTSFRFRIMGRSDDMLWVRGVNVFPRAVEQLMAQMRPQTTGNFQIIVDAPGALDHLSLRVERGVDVAESDLAHVARSLEEACSEHLRAPAQVTLVAPGSLPVSERKTRRVIRAYLGEDLAR